MNRIIGLINTGVRVSTLEAQAIAQAVDAQLIDDVCPDLGILPWRCRFYATDAARAAAGAYPLVILDNPDVAGAAGYHIDGAGKVFAAPTLDNGGTALSGPNSVSVTASHEAIEMVGDLFANFQADMGNGSATAEERCDACESQSYDKATSAGAVAVSDYLLDSWFDPAGKAPFDRLHKCPGPFQMSGSGDYMIVITDGQSSQMFGEAYPAWKRELKVRLGRAAEKRGCAGAGKPT